MGTYERPCARGEVGHMNPTHPGIRPPGCMLGGLSHQEGTMSVKILSAEELATIAIHVVPDIDLEDLAILSRANVRAYVERYADAGPVEPSTADKINQASRRCSFDARDACAHAWRTLANVDVRDPEIRALALRMARAVLSCVEGTRLSGKQVDALRYQIAMTEAYRG